MKSHFRRKKLELEIGTVAIVVWEYFEILDRIFKNIKEKTDHSISVETNTAARKRAVSEEVKEELKIVGHSPAPQDL